MRRLVGTVASGLGMFLVVFALLLHFYVVGVAVKFPVNTFTISTLMGHDVSYFNTTKLTELSGVTMKVTNTTQGDAAAGNSARAVYNTFTYIYDETNNQTFQFSTSRMAFDRKTGELINCCGAAVGTNTKIHMTGLGVLFPLGTKPQNYQVFNTTLLKPATARYEGQTTVDGLSTYKFGTQVPPTNVGTQQVPGSLIGSTQPAVSLDEYYQATITDWVNPATGVPVAVNQNQHIGLRDSTGAEKLVVFAGDLSTTPATVRASVHTVNNNLGLLNLVETSGPLIGGLVGIILLIGGIVIVLTGRDDEIEEPAEY
jgi:Porin PorA